MKWRGKIGSPDAIANPSVLLVLIGATLILTACQASTGTETATSSSMDPPNTPIDQDASDTTTNQQTSAIKVGRPISLTGYVFGFDEGLVVGHDLAVEDLNESGNLPEVAFVDEDVASDPSAASLAIQRLVSQSDLSILLGGHCSACNAAMAPAVANAKVPMLIGGDLPAEEQDRESLYTVFASVEQEIDPVIEWLGGQGAERIVILHDSSPFGTRARDALATAAETSGIAAETEGYDSEASDLTPILTRIRTLAPDAVVKTGTGPTDGLIAKNAAAMGFEIPIVARAAINVAEAEEIAGDDLQVLVFPVSPLFLPEAIEDPDRRARVEEFIDAVEESGTSIDLASAARGYDQVWIVSEALGRVAETSGGSTLKDILDSGFSVAGVAADYVVSSDNHAMVSDPLYKMATYQSGQVVLIGEGE